MEFSIRAVVPDSLTTSDPAGRAQSTASVPGIWDCRRIGSTWVRLIIAAHAAGRLGAHIFSVLMLQSKLSGLGVQYLWVRFHCGIGVLEAAKQTEWRRLLVLPPFRDMIRMHIKLFSQGPACCRP